MVEDKSNMIPMFLEEETHCKVLLDPGIAIKIKFIFESQKQKKLSELSN